jgi:hypothetical protein
MKGRLCMFAWVSMAAVLICGSMAWAQVTPAAQGTVECTGWHALCSLATDCKVVNEEHADCPCWQVNEQYVVVTADISNPDIKEETQSGCTSAHPCAVDESPVCQAIKSGNYTVDGHRYEWVSTYSYRGWCENWKPVRCDAAPWADCMTSPCVENHDRRTDHDRPLVCRCNVKTESFVGTDGRCKSRRGEVMSTINQKFWNFHDKKFTLDMPGYEYVQGACAPIHSDY